MERSAARRPGPGEEDGECAGSGEQARVRRARLGGVGARQVPPSWAGAGAPGGCAPGREAWAPVQRPEPLRGGGQDRAESEAKLAASRSRLRR